MALSFYCWRDSPLDFLIYPSVTAAPRQLPSQGEPLSKQKALAAIGTVKEIVDKKTVLLYPYNE